MTPAIRGVDFGIWHNILEHVISQHLLRNLFFSCRSFSTILFTTTRMLFTSHVVELVSSINRLIRKRIEKWSGDVVVVIERHDFAALVVSCLREFHRLIQWKKFLAQSQMKDWREDASSVDESQNLVKGWNGKLQEKSWQDTLRLALLKRQQTAHT
jgi:hypothetical protein